MDVEWVGYAEWLESIERRIWEPPQASARAHVCDLAHGVACIHCRACGAFLGIDGPKAWEAYWKPCNGSHTVTPETNEETER